MQRWTKLPFVATDDVIFIVLEMWPPDWRTSDLVELEKVEEYLRKDEAKLHIT